jgi:hypothetical protein
MILNRIEIHVRMYENTIRVLNASNAPIKLAWHVITVLHPTHKLNNILPPARSNVINDRTIHIPNIITAPTMASNIVDIDIIRCCLIIKIISILLY